MPVSVQHEAFLVSIQSPSRLTELEDSAIAVALEDEDFRYKVQQCLNDAIRGNRVLRDLKVTADIERVA